MVSYSIQKGYHMTELSFHTSSFLFSKKETTPKILNGTNPTVISPQVKGLKFHKFEGKKIIAETLHPVV